MTQKRSNILTLGAWAMAVLILSAVGFMFGKANAVEQKQVKHNIDKEAHPNIEGKLNMIEKDVSDLSVQMSEGQTSLNEMHDDVLKNKIILEQIQRTVNGG